MNTIRSLANDQCVARDTDTITTIPCGNTGNLDWMYDQENGHIINSESKLCLTENGEGKQVTLNKCGSGVNDKQTWNYHEEFGQIVNEKSNLCMDLKDGTLVSNTCQFDTFQGSDNFSSKVFYENNILAATQTSTSESTKRTKTQFVILLSLVLIFGGLSISGFGILTAVAIKGFKRSKRGIEK